ncbi:hypothetical protein Q5P01_008197 [Channa striata]|uniref:Uncharacterized protein n=1 Tax=Channa striata TaxID=64152 RepID=A0AA88SX24_CHASR|nr:hypothetical protein Q5P01_008197 [Channa striata]
MPSTQSHLGLLDPERQIMVPSPRLYFIPFSSSLRLIRGQSSALTPTIQRVDIDHPTPSISISPQAPESGNGSGGNNKGALRRF